LVGSTRDENRRVRRKDERRTRCDLGGKIMKKTNKELLQFFGLKVGDRVKVEGFINSFVIFEKSGIQYVEEMNKNWISNSRDIIDFIHKLLGNEYEIIKPKKKVGEIKCSEMACNKCPLRTIKCDINSNTLYEQLENYEKNLTSFYPFEKAFINALKVELDKDVEKCEK
jgi:hypothetical protein